MVCFGIKPKIILLFLRLYPSTAFQTFLLTMMHHRLNVHEFEQAPGVGDGQGSLACCSPWGSKELDTTEQWNWMKATPFLLNNSHPQ